MMQARQCNGSLEVYDKPTTNAKATSHQHVFLVAMKTKKNDPVLGDCACVSNLRELETKQKTLSSEKEI